MRRLLCCYWAEPDPALPAASSGYTAHDVVALARTFKRAIAPEASTEGFAFTVLADDLAQAELETLRRTGTDSERFILDMFVEVVPFAHPHLHCGGWSRMLEMYRPDLWPKPGERCVGVGLDTIFVRDPSWLWEWDAAPLGLIADPVETDKVCNGVATWNREAAEAVWPEFTRAAKHGMQRYLYRGQPSEMELLRAMRADLGAPRQPWPLLDSWFGGSRILSYKKHVASGPRRDPSRDAAVVYFHGRPKPADLDPDSENDAEKFLARLWRGKE